MTVGMTSYVKLAISLPSRAAENVRRAVKAGKAPSVSAYIAQAVEEKSKEDTLKGLLKEMLDETGGPPTQAERRWVQRTLGIKSLKRSRRRPR